MWSTCSAARSLEADVAIAGEHIIGLGPYRGARDIDLDGAFVAPGFIDAHVHIESALVPPSEFARAVVPRGTTTVVTDPHEIANVLGLEGIRFMFESAKYGPLGMYVMVSSCVPATGMATNGAVLHGYDLFPLKSDPWVLGLAEVMNYPGVIAGDDAVLEKIGAFQDCVIDGHSPALSGRGAAGLHRRRRAVGSRVHHGRGGAREAAARHDGDDPRGHRRARPRRAGAAGRRRPTSTASASAPTTASPRICVERGGIDHAVRSAIALGMDPVTAIRLATWNPAQHFRLQRIGAITPGRRADLVVFDDLQAPRARMVFRNGALVARDGRMAVPPRPPARALRGTMNVAWERVDLRIPLEGRRVRVIGVLPDQLVTESLVDEPWPPRRGGASPTRRAISSRWPSSSGTWRRGPSGRASCAAWGSTRGAIASSVAHDHHNLVVIGADDASMLTAARRVGALHGGMVVAERRAGAGRGAAAAGRPDERPAARDSPRRGRSRRARPPAALGSPLHDPFMAMSFLALEVIPALKLTDKGLVDVEPVRARSALGGVGS